MATRIFFIGTIILFFGAQFRAVDTFVLNEKVSGFVNKRIEKKAEVVAKTDPYEARFFDSYGFEPQAKAAAPLPAKRRITPPRWLGFSFLSIGAVLVLTSPLFRGQS